MLAAGWLAGPGALLAPSRELVGGGLGASGTPLGSLAGAPWRGLGASWAPPGGVWGPPGCFPGGLRASGGLPGRFWGPPGGLPVGSGGFLGASLGGSGGLLGPLGVLLGCSWAPKKGPWSVSWPILSLLKLSSGVFTSKL